MTGIICLWSGAIVDIPEGWLLCDGNNGTPDLTDRFIVGAGDRWDPNEIGGHEQHVHDFNAGSHSHYIAWDGMIEEGISNPFYEDFTESEVVVGTTDLVSVLPPYYALAFIIKQ